MESPTFAPDVASLLADLASRNALGRPLISLSLAPELVAAGAVIAAAAWPDGRISEVTLNPTEDALAVRLRIRVQASAWPPRPPVDTMAAVKLRAFSVRPDGALECTVETPLEFTSALADMLARLVGKKLPLAALRTPGARVALNGGMLLSALTPGLVGADRLRVFAFRVSATAITLDVGFSQ